MLLKFTVGNFLSFKEKQTLSLAADSLKEFKGHLHTPYFYSPVDKVLKSAALYGHNSHGKTNFLKAYKFFLEFIGNSFSNNSNAILAVNSFQLNTTSLNKPSFFEATFIIKNTKYRYGFEIDNNKVHSEWLFYSEYQVRENYLFVRNQQEFQLSKTWSKESGNRIENQAIPFAKPHILLLSILLSQESIPRISTILDWINSNIFLPSINENHESLLGNAIGIFSNPEYKNQILKFIDNADLGFTTIFDKIEETVSLHKKFSESFINLWYANEIKRFELYTKHEIYDNQYQLKDYVYFDFLKKESDGSIKYFILSCLFVYALKKSNLVIIDELDSRMHPLLFEMLIKLFHDPKLNSNGAQLIFTTHSTVLLNKKLRRDQILLVEKNTYGESSIRRIHTKETPVRIDTSIEKEYRKGELGGVSKKIKKQQPPSLFDDL